MNRNWRLYLLVSLASIGGARAGQFERTLYPVLVKADCRSCHNSDGVASGTRLRFPDPGAPPDRIEAFGRSLVKLTDRAQPERSLLFTKPTARSPHAGGERIRRGTPGESELLAWVKELAAMSPEEAARAARFDPEADPGAGQAPSAALRRLTNAQYNNTVRDLLGDVTAPANSFPPEDYVNGFKNQYEAQSLTPLLAEAYSTAAEKLARNAFRGGDTRGLIPCKPSAMCREQFVRSFGLKAFRRPLLPAEVKRYAGLFAKEKDFVAGAQLVVEAMLQSPAFLFRLEDSDNPRWKPYATASRISYAIHDSMPDAALFESAARGELNSREGVERAARRALDNPRAKQALDEFINQWLRLDRLSAVTKDRRRFPMFTRELAAAIAEEACVFVGDLVWNDRDFMTLFTAGYGFMNADLANLYGVDAPPKDFERVAFKPGSERAGILGQAAFLTLTSKPEDTSPTARGLFVREQFLCQKVADPPPGVNTNLPPISENQPQTNRQRLRAHVEDPSCATCHNLIDPIGFGLEKFDAIGARREKLRLNFGNGQRARGAALKSVELELDTSGRIAGVAGSEFDSPARLGAVLARTPQCQECVVKQYFRYTAGRLETPADRPLVEAVFRQFRSSGFRFKEMMLALIREREFPSQGETNVASHHQTR